MSVFSFVNFLLLSSLRSLRDGVSGLRSPGSHAGEAGCTLPGVSSGHPHKASLPLPRNYLIHPLTLSEVRIFFSVLLLGFPDGASGQELTCQRRIDPWMGKIPRRRKW